jgi:hypothetical protein
MFVYLIGEMTITKLHDDNIMEDTTIYVKLTHCVPFDHRCQSFILMENKLLLLLHVYPVHQSCIVSSVK